MPDKPNHYIVAYEIATAYWIEDGELLGCALNIDGSPDFMSDFGVKYIARGDNEKIAEAINAVAALTKRVLNAQAPYYWVVTGRIPGDDEDFAYVSPEETTRAQAEDDFKTFMIETALEPEDEANLRERLGVDATSDLKDYVYIVSTLRSNAPIEHA